MGAIPEDARGRVQVLIASSNIRAYLHGFKCFDDNNEDVGSGPYQYRYIPESRCMQKRICFSLPYNSLGVPLLSKDDFVKPTISQSSLTVTND